MAAPVQASVFTDRNKAGQTVDLNAAVHVPMPRFYKSLTTLQKLRPRCCNELINPRDDILTPDPTAGYAGWVHVSAYDDNTPSS